MSLDAQVIVIFEVLTVSRVLSTGGGGGGGGREASPKKFFPKKN